MIPAHLQGKSAENIITRIKQSATELTDRQYIKKLEYLVLLAIKDALCNTDGERVGSPLANIEEFSKLGIDAERRAIAFLNMVLPKE